ncbi:MAG TPA: MFS transporter [Spirochaetes bacterium]|nr:MFS transporter [Spirochaetota bacterium]
MKKGFVVPLWEKIAFGVGDMPGNITYTALHFYFIFYVVNIAGIRPEMAGLIFLIGRVWDAVSDYIMGRISDRTRSRFGRRRPYLLFGAVPLGVSFALLWLIPFGDSTSLFLYYLAVVLLFNTTFTITTVPYNALHPELSQNYDERTSLSGFRMAFAFLANLIAAAGVAVIVDSIYPGRAAYRESYPVMGWMVAGLVVAMYLFTFLGTRDRAIHCDATIDKSGFFETLKSFWRLKEFRIALTMFLFNQIGTDIFMTIVLFFLKDVILVPENMTFVVMGIPLIVAVIAAPFWVKMGEWFGKKKALIISSSYFIFALAFCLVAPAGNLPFIIAVAAFAGIGMSASQVIPWSILPDVIEIDEYENGVRREGAFYGITTFLYKAASAIAVGVATTLLGYFGYIEGSATQPASAQTAIRLLTGLGPALFFFLTILAVKRLPITRERFEEVMAVLNARKAAR